MIDVFLAVLISRAVVGLDVVPLVSSICPLAIAAHKASTYAVLCRGLIPSYTSGEVEVTEMNHISSLTRRNSPS